MDKLDYELYSPKSRIRRDINLPRSTNTIKNRSSDDPNLSIELSKKIVAILQIKATDVHGVTFDTLKKVFRIGASSYCKENHKNISRMQWALARVYFFLDIKSGKTNYNEANIRSVNNFYSIEIGNVIYPSEDNLSQAKLDVEKYNLDDDFNVSDLYLDTSDDKASLIQIYI